MFHITLKLSYNPYVRINSDRYLTWSKISSTRLRPLSAEWELRPFSKPVRREVETLTCLALDACCVSV